MMDTHYNKKANLIRLMTEWIDFYNNRRIKTKLNGKSPVGYQELSVAKAA